STGASSPGPKSAAPSGVRHTVLIGCPRLGRLRNGEPLACFGAKCAGPLTASWRHPIASVSTTATARTAWTGGVGSLVSSSRAGYLYGAICRDQKPSGLPAGDQGP